MDLLTYALAKKKASDELKERLDKIEAATAEAKQSAETSQAAAEQVKDLYEKTTVAAQQAAASSASATYALGPDETGRLSFFIKKTS
jgi:F0F1-type ATP synthase membrane subunit b/b'